MERKLGPQVASIIASVCLLSACAPNTSGAIDTAATQSSISDLPAAAAGTPTVFPTAESTGVPAGVQVRPWSGKTRTSEIDGASETLEGVNCKVLEGLDFDLGTSGEYLFVDDPCVVLRHDRFRTDAVISNTSAMVQQAQENQLLVIDGSEFDGGPFHQRGVQADYSDILVRNSRFTRFGNAAVEMNNNSSEASFTMVGNYLREPGGWQQDDHVDGFQIGAAGAVSISGNTVLIDLYGDSTHSESNVSNSALGLWAELGNVVGPVSIDGNRLAGGGYTIYLAADREHGFDWLSSVSVTNNQFDRSIDADGGIWGVLYPDELPANLIWTGNQWDDGDPLPRPNE